MTSLNLKRTALVGYKAASDLAGKAAFFAVVILAAHRLPTRAFGVFSLASTLGWMLSVGTDFGLQMHLAREVARAPDRTSSILAPILRLRLWLAASAIGLACVAFVALPARDALSFVLIVAAYIFNSLVEFLNYAYRGLSRSDVEATLNLTQRLGTLTLAGALLGLAPRVDLLAVALFLPPVAAFVYSAQLVTRLAGPLGGGSVTIGTADNGLSRAIFFRDVFPIGAGILLSALYFRVDLFLVEHWNGVEEVAKYNAVFRLIEALRLFPGAVIAVILPTVLLEPAPRVVWRLSGLLAGFGVVVAAALYQPAPRLLDIAYGARYVSAVPAFRALLLAFPLLSLNYGLTHQLIGWDGQRDFAVICGAALAVNLAMNIAWIPAFGITGAAWATLGTEAFLTAACVVALYRRRSGQPVREARARIRRD